MHFNPKLVLTLLATIPSAFAALNGNCTGRNGICINTGTCQQYGGQSFTGKCPSDPNDVKCCDSIPCSSNGRSGFCMFTSQCDGEKISGLCPGGNDFKCCIKSQNVQGVGERCNGVAGTCINVDNTSCGTQTVTGKCPGPNNVRCCLDPTAPSTDPNVGKRCNGVAGTCIDVNSSQCSTQIVTGKCPGGNNIRCCLDPTTPSTDPNVGKPCNGVAGTCIDVNSSQCSTHTVTGKCPGGNNIRCCVDPEVNGSRPAWYINQIDHTEVICTIDGKGRSVKSSGCGIACLSMAINISKGVNVTPESLFREGYNNGKYNGNGFSHGALDFLGGNHGVSISWTNNLDTVYSALQNGKPVIFHTGPDSTYHFTSEGHYILLYGAKTVNGIQKVFVFDPNGSNNHINELMTLRSANGGIEVAKRGSGADFGIVSSK